MINHIGDKDRRVLSFFDTGVQLQGLKLKGLVAIQTDDTLIWPRIFRVSIDGILESHTSELYFILISFGFNLVDKLLEIRKETYFRFSNILKILHLNNFSNFVERINEFHVAKRANVIF